jgi:DNA invertase Pin-like site-specific DNA recombinase
MRSSTSPAHAPTAPKLTKAIERVEGGHTDGIVVAKLDRFGRTLVDGVRQIDRIQKAGGTFASVADGFDISTDTGRLVLRIMLSLAEFELDRVRSNWEDARARAVARGIHPPAPHRRSATGAPATAGSSPTPTPRPS